LDYSVIISHQRDFGSTAADIADVSESALSAIAFGRELIVRSPSQDPGEIFDL